MSDLRIDEATAEDADSVTALIHHAHAALPRLNPPPTAQAETETPDSVRLTIADIGGIVARRKGRTVGAALFDRSRPGQLGLRRVSVDPAVQSHVVASAMIGRAEDIAEARGLDGVWLTVRAELPATIQFWERRGYWREPGEGPYIEMAKTLCLARELLTPDDTKAFGKAVAVHLAGGDLVVLTGGLGAGKTTLTQGIGAGLGVRGDVTSPTFVIARVHPSLLGGPALVHADAYRLGAVTELDDLDLDATVDAAVTVVEWGEGLAEGLSPHRLDIRLDRLDGDGSTRGAAVLAAAGPRDGAPVVAAPESRVVSVRPYGSRWNGVRLRSTLLP